MKKRAVGLSAVIGLLVAMVVAAGVVSGVSFMSTVGSSMAPGFRAGDLAVLHKPAGYGIGDVAAYRSRDLNTVVMHRIAAVDGDRYTFQGDNNSWVDPEQPARDQLLGKLALRVPRGGVWLDRATSRMTVIAVAFVLVAGGGTRAVGRRRASKHQRRGDASSRRTVPPTLLAAAGIALAAAIGAASVAAVAWKTPVDAAEGVEAVPPATMTYSYAATVPATAAYDGTTVTQPQPIFGKVTDRVDVRFTYASATVQDNATLAVDAELSTANGWRSTLPLQAPSPILGTRHTDEVELDLVHLRARAEAAAEAVGTDPAGTVAVTVVANVVTAGKAVFRSELPFSLDSLALRLVDGQETPLTVTDAAVPPTSEHRGPFSVLGRALPVRQVRFASLVALVVALLAAAVLTLLARRARAAPEHVRIQARYAAVLLDVEPVALRASRPVIEVPLIRGLARLAEQSGVMVLHWRRGGVHTYVVLEDNATYRFRTVEMPCDGEQSQRDRDDGPPPLAVLGEPELSPPVGSA